MKNALKSDLVATIATYAIVYAGTKGIKWAFAADLVGSFGSAVLGLVVLGSILVASVELNYAAAKRELTRS